MASVGRESGATLYIGDSERDLMAATAAGCGFLLVLTGNGAATAANEPGSSARACADLAAGVELVLGMSTPAAPG